MVIMKISIALATYNGARYLPDQLKSFIDQTRMPDELVINDDGSTDDTIMIIERFAKNAPFPVYYFLNKKNLGYTRNFDEAIMKTSGDLVFLSDQDDVWFPGKIAHVESLAENNPENLVIMNNAALTDEDLNEVGLTALGQFRSTGVSSNCFVYGCFCAVRRELLNICMPIPDGFKGHDNWIVGFADAFGARLIDDVVLQYYRRHDYNESQILVNRLKKISRIDRYKEAFNHNYNAVFDRDAKFTIDQRYLFLQGIFVAKSRCCIKYQHKLELIEKKTYEVIDSLEVRMHIRKKKLLTKSLLAIYYFSNGGYKHASGINGLIKDLYCKGNS